MEELEDKIKSLKKQTKMRIAIFLGYNGKKYSGLQFHNEERIITVEKVVFKALIDSGFILPQHMGDVKNVAWTRGARTDKGVHALVNTVSCKVFIDDDTFVSPFTEQQLANHKLFEEQVESEPNSKKQNQKRTQLQNMISVDKKSNINYDKMKNVINSNLPEDIRVFTIKPVTNGFNVRHAARSRRYEYYMPMRIFQSNEDYKNKKEYTQEEYEQKLAKIQELIDLYKGTKNFHNFTIKIRAKDPEAMRYMIDIKASIVTPKDSDEKWVRFQLHGASFMYHQIRKMIGMISMLFQKGLQKSYLENAFFQNRIAIWLAPAEGLFLNRIDFSGYNRKGDVPAPLILSDKEEEDIEKFRVYLQEDVVLTTGGVFDEYINFFCSLNEEEIEKASEVHQRGGKKNNGKVMEEEE